MDRIDKRNVEQKAVLWYEENGVKWDTVWYETVASQ